MPVSDDIGISLLFGPITALADMVPFVGGVFKFGAFLASVVLAVVISTTFIAVEWFLVRPLLAICLPTGALGCLFLSHHLGKRVA